MNALKQIIWILADLIGLNLLFRRINRSSIPILMYHGIVETELPFSCWTILSLQKFHRQMLYLKKRYDVLPLISALGGRDNTPRPGAVITFDDGLLNNYTVAWPILRFLELPATIFIVPELSASGRMIWADELFLLLISQSNREIDLSSAGFGHLPSESVDQRRKRVDTILNAMKSLPDTERIDLLAKIRKAAGAPLPEENPFELMNPDQIRELANGTEFSVAAHTNTHPILSRQAGDIQRKEIVGSMQTLREWKVDLLPVFAYPNGRPQDFTEETISIVKEAGCKAALSTIDGHHHPGDDRYRIKRVNIGGDISMAEFKARLSGFYYFLTMQ